MDNMDNMDNQMVIDATTKQDEYINILKTHFPSAISQLEDGSYIIDKEQLQLMLEPKNCKIAEDGYGLKWVGKKESYHNAYIPHNKILKPNIAYSKNFDTTSNVLIKGDNLEVLKLLRKNYFEKIKMIYIDPPYNTQNDGFIYNDNFTKSQEDVLDELGYSTEQCDYIKNIAGAKTHSGWLSFMYPRLLLARDLLRDDGVIFISIDDNEQAQLKLLCDEVFGQENFVIQVAWRKTDNQANIGDIARVKEYIISFAKNRSEVYISKIPLTDKAKKEYSYKDNLGKYRRAILLHKTRGRHYYDVKTKSGKILNGPWMVDQEKFNILDDDNKILWTTGGDEQPYGKIYLHESNGQIANDFWDTSSGSNQEASLNLEQLMGKRYFDFPKSINLLKKILSISLESDDIILDFFAGSGTTGDAVMQLNAEDGGNRKFILVQLAEPIDPIKSSETYNFVTQELKKEPTIFEITAERLRRAGEKIIVDNTNAPEPKNLSNLDIGFKIYEMANDEYSAIYDRQFTELSQDELELDDGIRLDNFTILTNLLLGSGIQFDKKVETIIADILYRVDDKLFVIKEFELELEFFVGIEYVTIYTRHFEGDSFIINLTSYIDSDKITIKG